MFIKKTAVAVAVSVAAFGVISCGGNKTSSAQAQPQSPVASQPAGTASDRDLNDEVQRRQRQRTLDSLDRVEELERLKHEQQLATARSDAASVSQMEAGRQAMITPCIEDSFDSPERMGALGISRPMTSESSALNDANGSAKSDLAQRFAGVLQSMVEDVTSSGESLQGTAFSEAARDNTIRALGEKVVNKHMSRGCFRIVRDKHGRYIAYQALYIPLKEAVAEVANADEVRNTRLHKEIMMNKMDKQLEAARERQKQDAAAVDQKYREQMGQ